MRRGAGTLLLLIAACARDPEPQLPGCDLPSASGERVLVFTRTTGYRHESIPVAVAVVDSLGRRHGFHVEHTEHPAIFADDSLRRFQAVIFLHTTGDVLDTAQQGALERFIAANHGFVGIHSASDTEYDWPWYGALVGAYFKAHPAIQSAKVTVRDTSHHSTRCVPAEWTRTDEWYDFRAPPPAGAAVLATLDESTYSGGTMGANHPIAWHQRLNGGRAWYTAMGHTAESWADVAFRDHVAGGILWALGR